jgi:hypothetical protein
MLRLREGRSILPIGLVFMEFLYVFRCDPLDFLCELMAGILGRKGENTDVFLIGIKATTPGLDSFAHDYSLYARSISMMDIVMLAIGIVFFALSIVYVYACDQL